MARPLVSVVTPSYNQASYITDALDSVKRQHLTDVEHIVCDGGSTDGTLEILERYETDYPLRWSSEADEGQSDAINKGFERATGDIVGWLNSDDVYFDKSVFERVVDHFDRTDADVIYGDLVTIDEHSTVIGVDLRPDFDYRHLLVRTLIGQPAVFLKAEVVSEARLDTSLEYSMDYEFWLRLAQEYEFRHVDDILAGFRRHRQQKTVNQSKMRAQSRNVAERFDSPSLESRVLLELFVAEVDRFFRSISQCIRLSRTPPQLAFDGNIAPFSLLLSSVFPTASDLGKFIERY